MRIAVIANFEVVIISDALQMREICSRDRLLAKAGIFGILHDADDFEIAAVLRITADPEPMANRRFPRKEAPRHSLIDDRDFGRGRGVLRTEEAANHDRNSHRGKISRADYVVGHRQVALGAGRTPLNHSILGPRPLIEREK